MATATRARRAPASRDERHQKVTALSERLAAYATSLDPAEQAAYTARFDGRYSPRNSLLIVMQAPDATIVHGFGDWKTHGRKVRRGEHGIQILAPAGAFTVPDRTAPAGPAGEPGERTIQRFRVAYVFAYAQTEPLDTPGRGRP